jgi:DNA replication factor GINS
MKLDDLRSILLSERETGRLTSIAPDIFDKGHAELAAITKKVYAFEDPFSDEARSLIDETLSIRETLQDIFAIRTRKILALTVMHAEGNYYDREEVKRMIPAEREMFDQITAAIEQGKGILIQNQPHAPLTSPRHTVFAPVAAVPVAPVQSIEEEDEESEPLAESDDAAGPGPGTAPQPLPAAEGPASPGPITHPCALVRVLQDMDSFMGVDGRIYTLSKGDIVTLPERNAAVLTERNIVLNINLCK